MQGQQANWQKSKTRVEGDSIDEIQDIDYFSPWWTLNVRLRSLDFILQKSKVTRSQKSTRVIKQRVISVLFFRKISGCCVEDRQQEGKRADTENSVETCANGHHA